MPQEIGWRPANDLSGGFDGVNDEHPLPVQVMRALPYYPQPFSFVLAGSASMLVKPGQGWLNSQLASNINAALRFLQVFNQATAPVTGDVPKLSIPLGAGTATVPLMLELGDEFLGKDGLLLTNGIALGVSTTAATFTAATVTDHTVNGTAT